MTTELSKDLMCILMRSGVEIWLERDRAKHFTSLLSAPNGPQFIQIADSGNMVNRADVTGIFTPDAMNEMKLRKNGGWKCVKGEWHERNQTCECMAAREEWKPPEDAPDVSPEKRQENIDAISFARDKILEGKNIGR